MREGNGNPLQYSCLENPMDRGAWWATVYRVAKSQTQLSDPHYYYSNYVLPCFSLSLSKMYCLTHRFWHSMYFHFSFQPPFPLFKIMYHSGDRQQAIRNIRLGNWRDVEI